MKPLFLVLCLRNAFIPPDVIARRNDEAISLDSNVLGLTWWCLQSQAFFCLLLRRDTSKPSAINRTLMICVLCVGTGPHQAGVLPPVDKWLQQTNKTTTVSRR